MSFDVETLYQLLPAVYRVRDAEQGEPLKALVAVIAEQVAALEENMEQLYDDQFIETCADWVVPYIGDLIGYKTLHGVSPEVASPRAEVAHTIGHRRRKGTASMLEQLARDVTGWNARVVEFFQLLATTQYMNHLRPDNHYAPDLRQWSPLEKLGSPFETSAHTVEVRNISNEEGRYNIPNIGIYLWRLDAHSLSDSPAKKLDARRYFMSPLGNDTPVFTLAESETEITHLAAPTNVPAPISRRTLHEALNDYYGAGKSLHLEKNGVPVLESEIVVCNLSDDGSNWAHKPANLIGIDPVLGRIAFPQNQPPPTNVEVTYHYGFSARMGGGEYERAQSFSGLPTVEVPSDHILLQDALTTLAPGGGIIEIENSGRYAETLSLNIGTAKKLEVRAANERRPTLVLGGDFEIRGSSDSEISLNGLLVTGGKVTVPSGGGNRLRTIRLSHCTLVPGQSLTPDGEPQSPVEPALVVNIPNVRVVLEKCIVGGLRVHPRSSVTITDSIVDATDITNVAYARSNGLDYGGQLDIENCTMIGKVNTRSLEATQAIFLSDLAAGDSWDVPVRAEQKQKGCVRFSYVPLEAIVPRRYRCQPENEAGAMRVRPQFSSIRYGDPGYGQLSIRTSEAVRRGAEDESEMGAFHDLFQPQRETNLRVRLEEYLRIGLEAGIFYVT